MCINTSQARTCVWLCKIPFLVVENTTIFGEYCCPAGGPGLVQHQAIFCVTWLSAGLQPSVLNQAWQQHTRVLEKRENLRHFPLSCLHSSTCSTTLISFPYLLWHCLENGAWLLAPCSLQQAEMLRNNKLDFQRIFWEQKTWIPKCLPKQRQWML